MKCMCWYKLGLGNSFDFFFFINSNLRFKVIKFFFNQGIAIFLLKILDTL